MLLKIEEEESGKMEKDVEKMRKEVTISSNYEK
jgi:hypothetical protein